MNVRRFPLGRLRSFCASCIRLRAGNDAAWPNPAARLLAGALLVIAVATTARAQFELRGTVGNSLWVPALAGQSAVPTSTNPVDPPSIATQPQFGGIASTSIATAGLSATGSLLERFPAARFVQPGTSIPTGGGIVLLSSRVGGVVALGVPRYFLGDIIARPMMQADGITVADALYWRPEPAKPGEVFAHPAGPQDDAPVPGAATPTYYHSPHAGRVFATQVGRVSVTWVTRQPVTIPGDSRLRYRYLTEDFTVSSATQKPMRTIYWTERSFNAPAVNVPAGKIETINPIYSTVFPRTVASEYQPVGTSTSPGTPELRTLWFEKTAGVGALRAYNLEGRVFVEYLGPLVQGTAGTHEFLGADILEVVRAAPAVNAAVDLGKQITPRDHLGRQLPLDGSPEYVASPVLNTSQDSVSYYGSVTRADGRRVYYAERENDDPDRVTFYWLQQADAAIHLLTAPATPQINLFWPVAKNTYTQRWPNTVNGFAHAVVNPSGSTPGTGIQFSGTTLPQIVYQDDVSALDGVLNPSTQRLQTTAVASTPATSAVIDPSSQRLHVTFSGRPINRALLKFTSGNEVWYVPLYTQAEGRANFFEGDGAAAIDATAFVGQRIEAPAGYATAGYIASGMAYNPRAYKDPYASGVPGAATGAIIPVNAVPGSEQLQIRWFKRIDPASAAFATFYVPSKTARYTVAYPRIADKIVLASNAGTGDLSPSEIAGSLYVQNDRTRPGFNPNEEHAVFIAGRAYALRDDLNDTSANAGTYTSEPFVLIDYTSSVDQRPAMHAFKVVREVDLDGTTNDIVFNYPVTAGTILQGPMPLPLLPLPVDSGGSVRNTEVAGSPDTSPHAQAPALYAHFTFEDRKGYHWVFRGPHGSATPTFGMQYYYTMREGFFVPGVGTQPPVGTILPYLRPLVSGAPTGDPVNGTPLTITYRPVWPERSAELRVAETLTLAKFGLPEVLTQSSAQVVYQQSIANFGSEKASVTLHDPLREKTFALSATGLTRLPDSALTSTTGGKTYFQGLPPHLQNRFFFDPLRGAKGALVLRGAFFDVPAGEDYVQLNVLSADDRAALLALVNSGDPLTAQWATAVDNLTTQIETFREDPQRAGKYIVDATRTVSVGPAQSATIADPDTAVQDYALTGTGQGAGWVTLVFGNGRAFTDAADPVSVQVIKVVPQLYQGELKVQPASNPLDEQVTLFHSGDFAARPDDYEFEWRYAPPQDGVAPPTYLFTTSETTLTPYTQARPTASLPTAADYSGGATIHAAPYSVAINASTPIPGRPGVVLKAQAIDFTEAVPARIVFSAAVPSLAGYVVYINGAPAIAHQAPAGFSATPPTTGLIAGALAQQFDVSPNFFRVGTNTLEIALFSTADVGAAGTVEFKLHTSAAADRVLAGGSPWQAPNGTLPNLALVGGSPTAPLGSPLLVLSDNYFTMRYRPKASANSIAGTGWSRWMQPVLVEGWIKRVLTGINPFNQRMRDFNNNTVSTDVSILTQAGQRWEGNVPLNLQAVSNAGLIEIYESVLNRGKTMSIDAGYDYGPANDALLLAAGYLNDLYAVLGNEAFADAANPTISVDDSTTVTEVNTSRFSFEGQVASVLDEELALLRGRDDFLAPGIATAPAYNRLFWNYTRGINSGEALYAVNYNIQEKAGSPTADGVLDAADAQRMFPQGHGDAYGHYLTALAGYYRLLRSPHFTWTPRTEAVTVLGRAVQVDYFDERKFAATAANLARTASQVLALTYRQSFKDDAAFGWQHFRDGKFNAASGTTRQWGVDEWASRAAQGAYYHWVVGNAILPDVDNHPQHTGIQVIDRTTVTALRTLAESLSELQSTVDSANAHLNPLGLSPGAIAFDISPAELKNGRSHYEQVYGRALQSVLNAKGAFDQAAKMTRSLRNQENQLTATNNSIVDQEGAFSQALQEIYGTPYAGDIGVGKTYATGYSDFDLHNWFVIDRPSALVDTTAPITISVRVPTEVPAFVGFAAADIAKIEAAYTQKTQVKSVTIQPHQLAQFSDVWFSGGSAGARRVTGKLQFALLELYQAQVAFAGAKSALAAKTDEFERKYALFLEILRVKLAEFEATKNNDAVANSLIQVQASLNGSAAVLTGVGDLIVDTADAAQEFLPKTVGLSNDATSAARGGIKLGGAIAGNLLKVSASALVTAAGALDVELDRLERNLASLKEHYAFSYEQAQFAYEYELLYRELIQKHFEIAQLAGSFQAAAANLMNLLAEGETLQSDRAEFRQRAAAQIQGYRTRDLTFRTFRNEALEQYRSLFDLASRYTYLAAKSYDYETGLLGSAEGQAVIDKIVASRSLGDLTGGVPQATVSTLGDAGLAGTMARLQADWAVAEGRLGINNPDQNGTLFSLRRELFRILDDATTTDDDAQWQQTLESHVMSNVLADPDVAAHALNLRKPDGSAVPGIVIPFRSTIEPGANFFGLPLAAGDHAFTSATFSTKIYSAGVVLRGYIGMDASSSGSPLAGTPASAAANALSATPYVYLIPTGTDYMRAPPLGDTGVIRAWTVRDQALPLPFNLGATAFNSTNFYNANGTLSEQPWILRKHQPFRPVADPQLFYSSVPAEFTSSRLVGRSAWNSQWKLVIPANTLLANEQEGLNRFVASVKDIELFLRTYSHAGN
jgi:hypothetical protein